jgi:hypothetical protein
MEGGPSSTSVIRCQEGWSVENCSVQTLIEIERHEMAEDEGGPPAGRQRLAPVRDLSPSVQHRVTHVETHLSRLSLYLEEYGPRIGSRHFRVVVYQQRQIPDTLRAIHVTREDGARLIDGEVTV